MKNEPEKWRTQTWMLPDGIKLTRDTDNWTLTIFERMEINLTKEQAEKIYEGVEIHQKYIRDIWMATIEKRNT